MSKEMWGKCRRSGGVYVGVVEREAGLTVLPAPAMAPSRMREEWKLSVIRPGAEAHATVSHLRSGR